MNPKEWAANFDRALRTHWKGASVDLRGSSIIHEAWKRSGGAETMRLGLLRSNIDTFYGEAVGEEIWREARTLATTTQRSMEEAVEALVSQWGREKGARVAERLDGVRPAILPEGYRDPNGVGWSPRFDLVHRLALVTP